MNKTLAGGLLNSVIENSIKKHNITARGDYPRFLIEEEVIRLWDDNHVLSSNDIKYLIFLIEKYEKTIYPNAYKIDGDYISLTKSAESFLYDGGFQKIFQEESRENYFKEQLISVNDSVIETNNSFRKTNNKTLFIASLAALFSLIALIQQFKKSNEVQVQELKETNKLLQKTLQQVDSLQAGKNR